MKTALVSLLLSFGLAGCSHWFLQHGDESNQPVRRAHAASTVEKQKPGKLGVGGVLGSDENGILVTAAWMKRYQDMEKKFGGIPGDAQIWAEGENFRINSDVSAHFSEMKITENVGLTPTNPTKSN